MAKRRRRERSAGDPPKNTGMSRFVAYIQTRRLQSRHASRLIVILHESPTLPAEIIKRRKLNILSHPFDSELVNGDIAPHRFNGKTERRALFLIQFQDSGNEFQVLIP